MAARGCSKAGLLVLALAASLAAADQDSPCKPLDPQGREVKDSFGRAYDLSPLRRDPDQRCAEQCVLDVGALGGDRSHGPLPVGRKHSGLISLAAVSYDVRLV